MKMTGTVTIPAHEIKEILVAEIAHRFGLKITPDQVWLGLVTAGAIEVEAKATLTDIPIVATR